MNLERRRFDLEKQIPNKLIELALTAKTIPLDDPRVQEHLNGNRQNHTQYRNNFSAIFEGLKLYITTGTTKTNDFYDCYFHKFIKVGVNPDEFYKKNEKLCEELFQAFQGTEEYHQLLWGTADLFREGREDFANYLNEMVPNPIGIEAVGMYAWDMINPLLEKADNILKEMGINTENFGI